MMTTPTENTTDEALMQSTLDGDILNHHQFRKRSSTKQVYPKTVYLKNIQSWRRLFNGFQQLKGVTYVTSPDYLLDLYSNYDFQTVELVIGSGYIDGYKKDLEGKETAIHALFSRVCDDSLILFGTKATVHTKLYMLTNEEKTRIIVGSPNLSYTAEGSRQR